MAYRLTAVIEKDRDGYYAYCPELRGCQSQGETFEEAQANIQAAIALYLETLSDVERQYLRSSQIASTANCPPEYKEPNPEVHQSLSF
jgi:predicted RNase H-like HicB family nuclease